jgi:hypothetical protein
MELNRRFARVVQNVEIPTQSFKRLLWNRMCEVAFQVSNEEKIDLTLIRYHYWNRTFIEVDWKRFNFRLWLKDPQQGLLLTVAFRENFKELIFLFELGLLPRGEKIQGQELIHFLVKKNALDAILALFKYHPDPFSLVNTRITPSLKTPLHLVGSERMVEILFEVGADMQALDASGNTPLHSFYESQWFDHPVFPLSFVKASFLNIQNDKGETPLFIAMKKKHFQTAKLLIDAGADINLKTHRGFSPLSLAHFFSSRNVHHANKVREMFFPHSRRNRKRIENPSFRYQKEEKERKPLPPQNAPFPMEKKKWEKYIFKVCTQKNEFFCFDE